MKVAYFVLGMHRSGTSALASTLQSLGIEFGSSLLDPTVDNPKGYFENAAVQAFNETALTYRGYSWDDISFDVANLPESDLEQLVARAQQIITAEFGCFKVFGVKDPRLCILFPIWAKACSNLDIEVRVILAYRHPLEVAKSLRKRNGFNYAKSFSLWCEYMGKAERYSRTNTRILTTYHDLVEDFSSTVSQLAQFGDIDLTATNVAGGSADRHPIDSTLRHYNTCDTTYLDLPECINVIYKQFAAKELDEIKLDKAFSQFELFKTFFVDHTKANYLAQTATERKKYKSLKDDYLQKIEKLKAQLSDKDQRNTLQKEKIINLESQLATAKEKVSQQETVIAAYNRDLQKAQQQRDELRHKTQLIEIKSSYQEQDLKRAEKDNHALQQAYDRAKAKIAKLEQDNRIINERLKNRTNLKANNNELGSAKALPNHSDKALQDWLYAIAMPLQKVAGSSAFKADPIKSFNVIGAAKLSNRMREAISVTCKSIETAKHIPASFIANFDDKGYLATNEDIAVAVEMGEFRSGLAHFTLHGFWEVFNGKRKIHPKRRFYKKPDTTEQDALADFSSFLRAFYNADVFTTNIEVAGSTQQLPTAKSSKEVDVSAGPEPLIKRKVTRQSPFKMQKRPIANYLLTPESTNHQVTVDIILPVYNALEDVKACIESLYFHQTHSFNLIVIDDCSESETEQWLQQQQRARGFKLIRNTENLRFTKTVNKGFAASTADYVVLLNSDTIVTAYWLEKILLCFNHNSQTGIVGPLSNAASWQTVPVREDKENGGWLVNEIPPGYSVESMAQLVETVSSRSYPEVPSVNGFCYVIKRDVINKIGTLDEEYFPTGYGEEDDFSIRARKAGFSIRVADDTYIYHAKSKSYTQEVRKVLTVGGRKSLDKKHGKEVIENLIESWKAEATLPAIAKNIESYMHVATANTRVVYTAIFGDYDTLKTPEYVNPDWDYVCYTDNPNITSDIFTVKQVKPLYVNPTKNARMIKLLGHIFLPGFDFSLWIDGSVKLRGRNIDEHIDTLLGDHYISLHSHVIRTCVYEEEDACSQAQKDDTQTLARQIEFYRSEGMPEDFGVFETAEIIRDHNAEEVFQLNSQWWQQLDKFSIRDQISLPYVFWKYGYRNNFMPGNQWLDAYFHMYKHHQKITKNGQYVDIVIPLFEDKDSVNVDALIENIRTTTNYSNFSINLLVTKEQGDYVRQLASLDQNAITVLVHDCNTTNVTLEINNFIQRAKASRVCILSPFTQLFNSDWLDMLQWGFDVAEDIYVTGATILNSDFEFVASGLRYKRRNEEIVDIYNSRKLGATGAVPAVHESCLMIEKKRFLELGAFDTSLTDLRSAVIDYCHGNNKQRGNNYLILHSEVIVTRDDETLPNKARVLSKLNQK